ncbi:MAG: hypothetical protein LBD29_01160 [Treponema sp.]|jgi:hypothetical protein|nr:hypothetical protein [Treponema sp.]
MAQVSLYLDKAIFGKVERAAQAKGVSISKYVATLIQEHFSQEWSPDYAQVFGSVTDATFFPNGAESVIEDTARESL